MQYICGFVEDLLLEFLKTEGVFNVNTYLIDKQNKKNRKELLKKIHDLNNILKVGSIIMKRPYVDILSQDCQLDAKTQSNLQCKAHKSKYK
jgi:hypothetical protein